MRLNAFLCLLLLIVASTASITKAGDISQSSPISSMLNPQAALNFEQLSATRDRPLFTSSRKAPQIAPPPPPIIAVAAPVAEPPPPPQILLAGVIVDRQGPRAMLRADPTAKIIAVRLGDDVSGWKVTDIEPQRMTLSLDDRAIDVSLFQSKDHPGGQPRHITHTAQQDRVFEINSAGVLRSHRINHPH